MARIKRFSVLSKRNIKGSIFAENLKQAKAIASAKGLKTSTVIFTPKRRRKK